MWKICIGNFGVLKGKYSMVSSKKKNSDYIELETICRFNGKFNGKIEFS
mgnify:CR=1 FL=1